MAKTVEQPDDRARSTSTADAREQLRALLDTLTDEQVETVLEFAEALRRGRVVVSACAVSASDEAPDHEEEPATGYLASHGIPNPELVDLKDRK